MEYVRWFSFVFIRQSTAITYTTAPGQLNFSLSVQPNGNVQAILSETFGRLHCSDHGKNLSQLRRVNLTETGEYNLLTSEYNLLLPCRKFLTKEISFLLSDSAQNSNTIANWVLFRKTCDTTIRTGSPHWKLDEFLRKCIFDSRRKWAYVWRNSWNNIWIQIVCYTFIDWTNWRPFRMEVFSKSPFKRYIYHISLPRIIYEKFATILCDTTTKYSQQQAHQTAFKRLK